jgi:hypothetical protein
MKRHNFRKLNYCVKRDCDKLIAEADEIAAMIVGLSKSLYSDI